MKNSKILIFILSVILLFVIIKFMKRFSEGFAESKVPKEIKNLGYDVDYRSWSQFYREAGKDVVGQGKEELIEFLKKQNENLTNDQIQTKVTRIFEILSDRYKNKSESNNPYRWRSWKSATWRNAKDIQKEDRIFESSDLSKDYTIKTQIENMKKYIVYLRKSSEEHSWKGDVNSRKIDQIIEYINFNQLNKDEEQNKKLSESIESQKTKDKEQDNILSGSIESLNSKIENIDIEDLLKEEDFDKYKATQQVTDSEQDGVRDAFINKQYKTEIDAIKKSIIDASDGSSTNLKTFIDTTYTPYVTKQLEYNQDQDKDHEALETQFTTYSKDYTINHNKLNKDLQDHLTEYNEYKTSQEQKDSSQDTALSNWENIFKSSQVDLGIRIKCQNKDTGEWGKTPGEFCPDWYKSSLSS